jgi:hypothetical protein
VSEPSSPPGWYSDPDGSGGFRWWDGRRWTERRALGSSSWRMWFTSSALSLRVDRVVAWLAGLGLACSACVALYALAARRPVPSGVVVLLIPGIPTLAVGQLWAIGVLQARTPKVSGGWLARVRRQSNLQRNPRRYLFGGLSAAQGYGLVGVIGAAWVIAVTAAIGSFSNGSAVRGAAGCRWALENHGVMRCVSHATSQHTMAAAQRFASGILCVFFAIHFGVAAGELRRRRGGGTDQR